MAFDVLLLLFFTMGAKLMGFVGLVAWMTHKTKMEEAREIEEAWDSGWSVRQDDRAAWTQGQ